MNDLIKCTKTQFLSSTTEKTSIMQLKPLERSQNSCDRLNTEIHVRTTLSKSHNARRNIIFRFTFIWLKPIDHNNTASP